MKFCLFPFLLLLVVGMNKVTAQTVNFEDGFEDSTFTSDPAWSGDANDFGIIKRNSNNVLQLQAEGDNTSYISVPSTNVTGYWEFFIELDFSPSGSNFAEIFLMSDIANLEGAVNGYALVAGESGSDDVFKIVRYDDGSMAATVLAGSTDISNGGGFRVRITRSSVGEWKLEVGKGYDGILQKEATETDNTYTSANYFGLKATYTSSRSDKFYFDFKIDLAPFAVMDAWANDSQITVTFSRPYDQNTVQPTDFNVKNGIGSPNSVDSISATALKLQYLSSLPSDSYTLMVQSIKDINGQLIADKAIVNFLVFGAFSSGNVIINEFMYDPPEGQSEYIELQNVSNKYLNLQGWQIADGTGSAVISSDTLTLPPNSYLVISGDTTALSNIYGDRLYAQSGGFPSLNNGGDAIAIFTDNGTKADSLNYEPDWGGQAVALERRSPTAPPVQANFGNSPHALGGTPGLANEVADDTTPPELVNLTVNDSQTITLAFSEKLQTAAAENESNFALDNGISVTAAVQFAPDSVKLTLGSALQNNTTYQLSITNQSDVFSNSAPNDTSFTYYIISSVDGNDIYISEFMYDPPDGQTEYIELYNPTDKSLNLQGWTLNDNTGSPTTITETKVVLPPDSYVVIAPDGTLLEKYPNITLIEMGSDFPSFNNSGDVIVIAGSGDMLLDSLSYAGNWGGNGVALERRTINVAPVKANFGKSPNGFGTPGNPNKIAPDTTAPALTTFTIVNNQELEFVFSEALDATPATTENNYTITGNLTVTLAELSKDTVRISLSDSLVNNKTYTISANKIKDLFGNSASIDTTFVYLEPSPVGSDDIYINEFMYDPPGGQTEYIELYNPTDKSLNLKGWTINDNTGNPSIITREQYLLPPNSYIVLAPDQTLLKTYAEINLITMGSDFPSFNNSGDNIVIHSQKGLLLDSLQYTDGWGGKEIALERRTVKAPPVEPNFDAALNGFGTPGSKNSIKPDNKPPALKNIEVTDAQTVRLQFTETILDKAALDKASYTFNPSVDIKSINATEQEITLHLSKALVSDKVYILTVKNLEDIFGNTMTTAKERIVFIKVGIAKPKQIVINEFLVNGEPEFVELYNRSEKNIDLSNWKIGDRNNTAVINSSSKTQNTVSPSPIAADGAKAVNIDENLILRPGQYLVITSSASLAHMLDNGIYISDLPSFNDDEDIIYIQNRAGVTIDSLSYIPAFGSAVEGQSAERKDPNAASNDPFNWKKTMAKEGYTAGAKNSVYRSDKQPPEIIFAKIFANGDVEVIFNEFIDITSKLVFKVNKQIAEVEAFEPTSGNRIVLNASNLATDKELMVTALNVSDVSGNVTSTTSQPVAQPLQPGDVVINEILFDPIDDSDDELPDQSEYIELYNTRDYAVSLENIYLHDAPDENGNMDRLIPVNTRFKWIPAGGTAVIYAGKRTSFAKTDFAVFFELKNTPEHALMRIDASSLSLSSSGDAVYLSGKEGIEIDSVFYSESWHNPNIVDTDGIALERINPEGASNDPNNWGSSTADKGGTPAAENTLFQKSVEVKREVGISFSSNPFSPDGDGFEDNLIISYKLNHPDYLMTVRIYDRYGRFIIELADSQPAGTEGTISWDGRKENGNRNRIGIYIVIFRAFDSANGKDIAFKETVVIARRLH